MDFCFLTTVMLLCCMLFLICIKWFKLLLTINPDLIWKKELYTAPKSVQVEYWLNDNAKLCDFCQFSFEINILPSLLSDISCKALKAEFPVLHIDIWLHTFIFITCMILMLANGPFMVAQRGLQSFDTQTTGFNTTTITIILRNM